MPGDRTVFVRLKADISDFQRGMATAGASTSAFVKRLDEADGRLSGMVQTGLALAPALAPLGAAVVPAVAGLATQLTLAAGAAGVALLAFHGIGDAVKAIDQARLEPTAANIAKMTEAMDKLGPAGQAFAVSLSDLEPKLKVLRNTAEAGLLPGVTEGIDSMMTMLPQVNTMVGTFARTLGDLAADAGKSLAGPQWATFFDYIDKTARPVLTELGQTLGNVIQGVANLMMDLDPLSRSFSSGLLDMAKSFNEWSQSVKDTEGFADFIDYVQQSGPQALDALGSIAGALIALVKAAAPVGSVMLPLISDLADLLGSLADSPIGPVLITTAAAVGTLGRSLALLKTVGLKGGQGGFLDKSYVQPAKDMRTAFREARTASAELMVAEQKRAAAAVSARDAQFAMVPVSQKRAGVSAYTVAAKEATDAAEKVKAAEATKRAAIGETAKTIGKAGIAAAGLAVASTGVADSMGLSNTASLAMLGTLGGPLGAAFGGAIGLAMDFAAANNDAETAVRQLNTAMASGSFEAETAALDMAGQAIDKLTTKSQKVLSLGTGSSKVANVVSNVPILGEATKLVSSHIGDDAEKDADKHRAAYAKMMTDASDLEGVYVALHHGDAKGWDGSAKAMDTWRAKITPAIEAAGMSMKDLQTNQSGAADAIRSYFSDSETTARNAKAVGTALTDIGDAATQAKDPIADLQSALDSLFNVELDQGQATDDWVSSLHAMRKTVKAAKGDINGFSETAIGARTAIRSYVRSSEAKAIADAKADHNGRKFADTMLRTRANVIATMRAAHATTPQINRMLQTMGLTPKSLSTIIRTPGVLSARQQVRALGQLYGVTPKQLDTVMNLVNSGASKAKIRDVLANYNLTPRQITTVMTAINKVKKPKDDAQKDVDTFHGADAALRADNKAKPGTSSAQKTVNSFKGKNVALTASNGAGPGVRSAQGVVNSFHGKTVTVTVRTQKVKAVGGFEDSGVTAFAAGGYGDGGQYFARTPQMVTGGANILWGEKATGWEAYISGMPSERDRNIDILSMAADRLGVSVVENARGRITDTFAKGGHRGHHKHSAAYNFDLEGGESAKRVRAEFAAYAKATHGMTRRLRELESAAVKVARRYNDQEKQLKRVQDKAKDLRAGAAGSFNNDIFGNGVAGLDLQLRADRNDSNAMSAALKKLRRKGLGGALAVALGQSGDLNTAQQLARMTPAQIAAESKLYASRARAQRNLGQQAVDTAGYTRQMRDLNKSLHTLNTTLNTLEHRVEHGARKGTGDRNKKGHHRRRAGR